MAIFNSYVKLPEGIQGNHLTWTEISFVQVPGLSSTRNDAVSDRQMSGSPRGQRQTGPKRCRITKESHHGPWSPSLVPASSQVPKFWVYPSISKLCFTWSFSGSQVFSPSFSQLSQVPWFFTNDLSGLGRRRARPRLLLAELIDAEWMTSVDWGFETGGRSHIREHIYKTYIKLLNYICLHMYIYMYI